MKIAVEGCAHGELDTIYDTIKYLEEKENFKIDLLICCGDFQSSRNEQDLCCMAVPQKYYNMCSFYKYYNGEKEAPVLTIFIGGNHEASNYLQELPYGGWVAPKIYYLGYAGVINIAGIRIGGISGIYKSSDFMKGHFETPPYNDSTKRSVYHIRNLEVFRLKQLSEPLDIFLSHDWPAGIYNYGNKDQLIRFKPHFEKDIETEQLGSKPCEELLNELKPNYWFAAHLHCKFAALVPHGEKFTRFLALDKCLPKRRFLQIIDMPHDLDKKIEINYDLEWLTILFLTNHLMSFKSYINYMPGPNGNERWIFRPTEEEKSVVLSKMNDNLVIPNNFEPTAVGYKSDNNSFNRNNIKQPESANINPQTVLLCKKLSIDDPVITLLNLDGSLDSSISQILENSFNNFTTFISDSDNSFNQSSRSSLILPDPVNNINSNENDEVIDNNLCKKEIILIEEKEYQQKMEEKKVEESQKVELPQIKKIKRRNADIYCDNDS